VAGEMSVSTRSLEFLIAKRGIAPYNWDRE